MTGCNCNKFGSEQDTGIIRTRDLPIKSISYGPLIQGDGSKIKLKVGDLKCSGLSPPTCKWTKLLYCFTRASFLYQVAKKYLTSYWFVK